MTCLHDLATRWMKETISWEELLDLMVRKQFLFILPDNVRVAVIERKPKNWQEASTFAENYLQAHSTSIVKREAKAPTTKRLRCGRHGHWAHDCTKPRTPKGRDEQRDTTVGDLGLGRNQGNTGQLHNPEGVRCYSCNERGHISFNCPKRSLYSSQPGAVGEEAVRRHRIVNRVYCPNILMDTGATQTLGHNGLVADDDIVDGEVTIRCAHGDAVSYPVAVVKINIGGKDIITTAAVSSTLPASVLLGWDVP